MDKTLVAYLKKWFHSYVKSYKSNDPARQRNINLKEKHTLRVCREITAIRTMASQYFFQNPGWVPEPVGFSSVENIIGSRPFCTRLSIEIF